MILMPSSVSVPDASTRRIAVEPAPFTATRGKVFGALIVMSEVMTGSLLPMPKVPVAANSIVSAPKPEPHSVTVSVLAVMIASRNVHWPFGVVSSSELVTTNGPPGPCTRWTSSPT